MTKIKEVTLGIAIALILVTIILLIYEINPINAFRITLEGAFGGLFSFSETLVATIPYLLCGLAVAIPLKLGVWNIGGEGQFHLGALFSTGCALLLKDWPAFLLWPLVLGAGFLGGSLWILVPAFLRSKYERASTILLTLMLNYVALHLFSEAVFGFLRDPEAYGFPVSPSVPEKVWLPTLFGTRLHLGIVIAIGAAVIAFLVINYTDLGIKIRALGSNFSLSQICGVNAPRMIMLVMLIGGGLAGLAGAVEILGLQHQLMERISPSYGYTGIAVAVIARAHLLGTIFSAFLLAALFVGTDYMGQVLQIPTGIVWIIQATIVLTVIAAERR